jgi:hypothetical protein
MRLTLDAASVIRGRLMERSQVAIIGALALAGLGVFAFRAHQQSRAPEEPHSRLPASAAASAPESPAPPYSAETPGSAPSNVLPDGRQIPELPADAPKSVFFGVVVFTYRGAEGAPSDARSKESALALAKATVPDAQRDFEEAVKKGDRGSTGHAGAMPQGVLEPGVEYVLFTLKKGDVYGEPVDTPRGYWILRRTAD